MQVGDHRGWYQTINSTLFPRAKPLDTDLPSTPRREFLAGCRDVLPNLAGTMPFGFVAGVAAIAAGMTAIEGIALSVLAFSGIAQLVASQLIAVQAPLAVIVGAAAVVSLRFLMYSAAIAPHIGHLDRRWRVLIAFLMTDQSFAMTVRRFTDPGDRGHRHWYFLGTALTLFVSWQTAVVVGVATGAGVPASWSLDFAVVLTFLALLVPAVRTQPELAAAIVAGAVSLLAMGLPYRLSLVIASLAGIVMGMAWESVRRR